MPVSGRSYPVFRPRISNWDIRNFVMSESLGVSPAGRALLAACDGSRSPSGSSPPVTIPDAKDKGGPRLSSPRLKSPRPIRNSVVLVGTATAVRAQDTHISAIGLEQARIEQEDIGRNPNATLHGEAAAAAPTTPFTPSGIERIKVKQA